MNGIINQLAGGLRFLQWACTGCANIEEMRSKPQFVRVTSAV